MASLTKRELCTKFFEELSNELRNTYIVVQSCNKDFSKYLVPIGTEDQITYESKPSRSFRISDHWNWYANTKKCSNPNYVQCLSVDLPWAKRRPEEGKASVPVKAIQVSVIGEDNKYHVVFGERFDRKTKQWSWVASDPKEVAMSMI